MKNFPILPDERVEELTLKGYVLVFRFIKAIEEEQPQEILSKDDYEKALLEAEEYPYYDKITKVIPFKEGYNFLKNSDRQFNLRSQLARELKAWASWYNISDETDTEMRKRFLETVGEY